MLKEPTAGKRMEMGFVIGLLGAGFGGVIGAIIFGASGDGGSATIGGVIGAALGAGFFGMIGANMASTTFNDTDAD